MSEGRKKFIARAFLLHRRDFVTPGCKLTYFHPFLSFISLTLNPCGVVVIVTVIPVRYEVLTHPYHSPYDIVRVLYKSLFIVA